MPKRFGEIVLDSAGRGRGGRGIGIDDTATSVSVRGRARGKSEDAAGILTNLLSSNVHKCVAPFLFLDIVHCARGGRGRARGLSEDAATSVTVRSHVGRGRGEMRMLPPLQLFVQLTWELQVF